MDQKKTKKPDSSDAKGMRNWYFKGWELQEQTVKGKKKRVWVYTGPVYSVGMDAADFRKLKIRTLISSAACLLLWICCLCCRGYGANSWAGFVILIDAIPLFYLISGLVTLLRTGPEMTLRSARGAFRYLRLSSAALGLLGAASTLLEAWLIVSCRLAFLSELPFLLFAAAGTAAAITLFRVFHSLEPKPLADEETEK